MKVDMTGKTVRLVAFLKTGEPIYFELGVTFELVRQGLLKISPIDQFQFSKMIWEQFSSFEQDTV
jgi:hypothetical protein